MELTNSGATGEPPFTYSRATSWHNSNAALRRATFRLLEQKRVWAASVHSRHVSVTRSSRRSPVRAASLSPSTRCGRSTFAALASNRAISSSVQMIPARCPFRYSVVLSTATVNTTRPLSRPYLSSVRSTMTPMSAARGVSARESRQATTLATIRASFHTASGVSRDFSSIQSSADPQVFFVPADSLCHSGPDGRSGSIERHSRISERSVVGSGACSLSCHCWIAFNSAGPSCGLAARVVARTQGPPRQA